MPRENNPVYLIIKSIKERMHSEQTKYAMKTGTYVDVIKREDIEGTWVQSSMNEDGMDDFIYVAQIEKKSITLYYYPYADDKEYLDYPIITWAGTFNMDIDVNDTQKIVSENYRIITNILPDASHEKQKNFQYEDGQISFIGTSLGYNEKIVLNKWSRNQERILKFANERKPYYNEETNYNIDFFGYHFEYPSYFDIKDDRSTEEKIVFNPSDTKAYAILSFRERQFENNLPDEEGIFLFSRMNENDYYGEEEDVFYNDTFLVNGGNYAMSTGYFTESGIRFNTCIIKEETLELLTVGVEYSCAEYEDYSVYDYITDFKSIISNAQVINK